MDEKQEQIMEKQTRISVLEAALRAGDYKVIKTMEARASGGVDPYDTAALTAERQKLRDEINACQEALEQLEAE